MAVNENTPTTHATEPVGNGGSTQEKLIAGKFKTVEEAVEQGYTGLEKQFHTLTEQVGTLTRLLEAAVAPSESAVPTVQGGQQAYYDPYNRNPNNPQNQFNPVDFVTNPIPYLQQREAETMNRVVKVVTDVVSNSMAVADFKARNPDIVKHEPLVQTFMRQTDPRKSVSERLEDAAKLTRNYLQTHVTPQSQHSAAPMGNDYVEAPRGSAPAPLQQSAPQAFDEEAELVKYINERNAETAQRFGIGIKK